LIGALLAISIRLQSSNRWLWIGLSAGFGGAILLFKQMTNISEWFDYAGQEVMNTTLQTITYLMIALCVWLVTTIRPKAPDSRKILAFSACAALIIFCAVAREGQEIILYLYGFSNTEYLQKTLAGGGMGLSIGASMGILLFHSLVDNEGHDRRIICLILLALFAGNMLSQSTVQLMQVDWLSQSPAVWDTSSIITEHSLLGELLYALIGYEATPTFLQSSVYISGAAFVLYLAVVGTRRSMQRDQSVSQETDK